HSQYCSSTHSTTHRYRQRLSGAVRVGWWPDIAGATHSSFSSPAALAARYGCVGTGEVGCVESVKNTGITLIRPLCWPLSVASFTLCAFVFIRQRVVMVDQVFVIAAYGINIVLGLLALVFLG